MSGAVATYFEALRASETAVPRRQVYHGDRAHLRPVPFTTKPNGKGASVKSVALVAGTRPEIIKLAPVYHALKSGPLDVRFVTTGQHGEMAHQALATFEITPELALDCVNGAVDLSDIQARMMTALSAAFTENRPDLIVVQGDTSSAFVGAMVGFNLQIPVAHVEAGLSSACKYDPFPEEMLRTLVREIAALHFAPTPGAFAHLERKNLQEAVLHLVGNTVVDAAQCVAATETVPPQVIRDLEEGERIVLITTHRREAWGGGIENICDAVAQLARVHPDVMFVWPVHLNPRVSETVTAKMSGQRNVRLTEPLGYADFIGVLSRATLALTDSGGVQEEAPSFGVPVLVMRNVTERPEAVEAGLARLVGTDTAAIFEQASELLSDEVTRLAMTKAGNPFGDGLSGPRIARLVEEYMNASVSVAAK